MLIELNEKTHGVLFLAAKFAADALDNNNPKAHCRYLKVDTIGGLNKDFEKTIFTGTDGGRLHKAHYEGITDIIPAGFYQVVKTGKTKLSIVKVDDFSYPDTDMLDRQLQECVDGRPEGYKCIEMDNLSINAVTFSIARACHAIFNIDLLKALVRDHWQVFVSTGESPEDAGKALMALNSFKAAYIMPLRQ